MGRWLVTARDASSDDEDEELISIVFLALPWLGIGEGRSTISWRAPVGVQDSMTDIVGLLLLE